MQALKKNQANSSRVVANAQGQDVLTGSACTYPMEMNCYLILKV